jgi:hypothetical protein
MDIQLSFFVLFVHNWILPVCGTVQANMYGVLVLLYSCSCTYGTYYGYQGRYLVEYKYYRVFECEYLP